MGEIRLKILVCMKQVPQKDAPLKLNESGTWIREDISYEVNEPDAYALEAGLTLKEKLGGEVVALCAGPERAASVIKEALAKGCDRAIHIEDDLAAADPLATARRLAAALAGEKPDLVLTGLQSDDLGFGQTGVILAELLGMAHATIVMEVEPTGAGIRVKRELEDGWFQHVELPLPAVLTIQSGISKLRYATLMGIKKAKTKEIRRVSAADLALASGAGDVALERIYLPERTKRTQLFDGPPREAAAQLVEKLKFEARVL